MKKALRLAYRVLLLVSLVPYLCTAVFLPVICYPIHVFSPRLAIHVGSFFAFWAWSVFSQIFRITASASFPRKLRPRENYLVISNHTGSIDFMVLNELAIASRMLSTLKYLIKDTALYIPVFGLGMKMIGFLYLRRNIDEDRKRITEYCAFVKRTGIPLWLVVYPEGTRFSAAKRDAAQDFCRRRGLPVLHNVLFPRTGGFKLLAENLRGSQIRHVADLTVFFDTPAGRVPSLLDFLLGRAEGVFRVDVEVTPLEDIRDFDDFVVSSFRRKDATIARWKSESPHRAAHAVLEPAQDGFHVPHK